MSKQAALELLGSVTPGKEPDARLAETIQKALGNCRRPVAAWLLTYTRMAKDPAAAAAAWTKLVEAEEALLKSGSSETSSEIVAAMLRFQVAWLKKTGRNDEAVAAIRRLIRLDVGDADSLIELVHWLNNQKAWEAVDELAARRTPQLGSVPMFRYAIAESQMLRGNKEKAEKLAAEVLAVNPGKDDNALTSHAVTAYVLRLRGLFAWAVSMNTSSTSRRAMRFASTRHHLGGNAPRSTRQPRRRGNPAKSDRRGRRRQARGDADASPSRRSPQLGRSPRQMNFFFACHWQAKGEPAKARPLLEKALADNPSDVDVLIACYRLPSKPPRSTRRSSSRFAPPRTRCGRRSRTSRPRRPTTTSTPGWSATRKATWTRR